MKPALAAGGLRPRIPTNAEGLQAPAGELDEILLQRIDAEGVGDAVLAQGAVGTVRTHEEPAILPEERRDHPVVGERGIVEVAQDRGGIRDLHGAVMMRTGEAFARASVTRDTRS